MSTVFTSECMLTVPRKMKVSIIPVCQRGPTLLGEERQPGTALELASQVSTSIQQPSILLGLIASD